MEPADVVVVGAGSAGAAVAARASEDPNRTVVLVEAGPDHADLAALPDDLADGNDNSYVDHDWGLDHFATAVRRQPLPRGKVTGGSSAVNTCIFLRGVPEDYDLWAALGNPEWAWERVLPAFRRIERDLDHGDEPHHGDAGPMPVRRAPPGELTELHAAFLDAADRLGHPRCPDQNHPGRLGAGPQPMNKLGRLRVSTAVAYLAPARARPNLRILSGTVTRRVVVRGRRACGVEVESADGTVEVVPARLVVLAAGAVHTPGILVRSGIGEAGELARLGVDPVAELAGVGANLCDHPALAVLCRPADPSLTERSQPIIQTILRYTSPGGPRADLQIEQLTFAGRPSDGLFGIAAVVEQVEGCGALHQVSTDPRTPPHIESRFCEDERDARRLAAALADALAFTRAAPLAGLVDAVVFPDPIRSTAPDDLVALVKRFAGSGYHPCGTARMGPAGDPGAVVDQYGRCHAVDQLVVADASIMPTVPRANTNPTSIMIGDRIGEWLRTGPSRYGL
jgi:choline dehydrogenase